MFFDPLYFLIVGPGMLLALWASVRTKRTFQQFSEVPTRSGLTGADVARQMLRQNGIRGVRIEQGEGFLSDHYDPNEKVVRLSPGVYHGRSIAAVGVAAHECGHVLQDAENYGAMRIRQSLVGPANYGSSAAFVLILAGLFLKLSGLIWLGIIGFSAVVLFQLVTLPVEFNASSRARAQLAGTGMIATVEDDQVGKVLNAAALTYVAALVTSLLTLAYYLLHVVGGHGDD
jgi:Zn-dependent membrane protease YugP